MFQKVKIKMGSCDFCKKNPKEPLKNCICKKASYCSKECQAKDWKSHKPSCPPYVIKESPGKGKGLFATRKIKEGQVIVDEYPFFTLRDGMKEWEFLITHYPFIDKDTKAKVLKFNDPAEDLKSLDSETVEELISKKPFMMFWMEDHSDELVRETKRFMRIYTSHSIPLLEQQPQMTGLYNNISWINHSCVPNALNSFVKGMNGREQVRALMTVHLPVLPTWPLSSQKQINLFALSSWGKKRGT